MPKPQNRPKCTGTTKKDGGRPCRAEAIVGGTVCRSHGGSAKQVKAKAAVRAHLAHWNDDTDVTIDPGVQMLRMLTKSAERADELLSVLNGLIEKNGGDLAAAMVGDSIVLDRDGNEVKVGEYVRGIAKLENEERDRCMTFAKVAHAAGLGERTVQLAERQAEIVIRAVEAALDAAGVPVAEQGAAKLAAARHLKAV